MTKPIPKVYTTRFFQLVTTRQFAEAERILERVKQKMHISERNRGYFQALYGMLLTQKNNDDRYTFLSGIDSTNRKQLKHFRQEFLNHVESRLHAEYDRGFFEAWADYMRILPRLEVSASSTINKSVEEAEEAKRGEAMNEAKTREETKDQIRSQKEESTEPKEESIKESTEVEQFEPGQSTLVDFAK